MILHRRRDLLRARAAHEAGAPAGAGGRATGRRARPGRGLTNSSGAASAAPLSLRAGRRRAAARTPARRTRRPRGRTSPSPRPRSRSRGRRSPSWIEAQSVQPYFDIRPHRRRAGDLVAQRPAVVVRDELLELLEREIRLAPDVAELEARLVVAGVLVVDQPELAADVDEVLREQVVVARDVRSGRTRIARSIARTCGSKSR